MLELNRQTEVTPQVPAVQINPKPTIQAAAFALLQNARVLIKHGESQLALNLLRQASSYDTHELILSEMTFVLSKLEKWHEAYRVCSQWCRVEVNFESVFYRAQIEYQMGLDDKSLQSYFEALSYVTESRSELFEIFKNIGNIYVRKADFELAEEFYNKSYAVKSDSDILLVNYGILEMQRGDLNRAKDRFRSAVQINMTNDKGWVGLAMAHFDFGDEELGIANLKKALDINPYNKTALSFALQKMTHKHHCEYLIETMGRYLSQDEFDEEISCQLIQKFYELGRFELALMETQRLLLWNPEKPEYFNLFEKLQLAQSKVTKEKAAC